MKQIVESAIELRKRAARHWAARLAHAAHLDHVCYFGAYVFATHEVVVYLAGGAFILLGIGLLIGEADPDA